MTNNTFRIIITYVIVIFYIFLFLYLSIRCPLCKAFCLKFIGIFKNREIGEALFIILFYLLPVSIIIGISQRIGKR